jgi:hypothetical protein
MLTELSNVTLDVLHDLAVRATRDVQQAVDVAADRETPLKTHGSRSLKKKKHFKNLVDIRLLSKRNFFQVNSSGWA